MKRCRRTIFLVDRQVQGTLIARTALYWLFCLFSVSLMLICWESYTGPRRTFYILVMELFHRYGPALLASLMLLPIALMDVVRLSNRFVGPVVRLKESLRALCAGERIQPLHFRDNDFWREIAGDINNLAARLNSAEQHSHALELPADLDATEVL